MLLFHLLQMHLEIYQSTFSTACTMSFQHLQWEQILLTKAGQDVNVQITCSKIQRSLKESPAHTKYEKIPKIFKTCPVQILVHEVLTVYTVTQIMIMSQPSLELQQ